MKIVAVTPWVPSATRPRSLHLLESLAKSHEVHVVCAVWGTQDHEDLQQLKVQAVTAVKLSRVASLARVIKGTVSGSSMQQSFLGSARLRRAVDRTFKSVQPDVGYFNVIRSAHLMGCHFNCAVVLDMDETRSGYYAQLKTESRNPFWRLVATIEHRRLLTAERWAESRADVVLYSSPMEVPNGTGGNRFLVRSPHSMGDTTWTGPHEHRRLVFVGRQCYRANVEAITWFVARVLPRLNSVHLDIVGEKPTGRVRRLRSRQVSVLGRVGSVRDFYREAGVSIVPVGMATGVQMKLIESLSIGVPTVCTSIVAKGAGVIPGKHCIVAEDEVAWSRAIEEILGDSDLAIRLSSSGREWARSTYAPEAIASALQEAIIEAHASFNRGQHRDDQ